MTAQKNTTYTFYKICIAIAVFMMFFLQTFLLVDGTNVFSCRWQPLVVLLP